MLVPDNGPVHTSKLGTGYHNLEELCGVTARAFGPIVAGHMDTALDRKGPDRCADRYGCCSRC